jgi:hypothetical protein
MTRELFFSSYCVLAWCGGEAAVHKMHWVKVMDGTGGRGAGGTPEALSLTLPLSVHPHIRALVEAQIRI